MEENKNYCVYKHTNKINGKVYIGLTGRKPEYRWNNGNGYKHNPYFYSSIQKYGWENFDHEIIKDNLTEEQAQNLEILLIAQYKSINKEFGYNVLHGGNLGTFGVEMSEETRKKMSESRTGEGNSFYGKKHTEESKEKMSFAKKGKYCGKDSWNYGRHASEETKRRKSEASKGRNIRGDSHLATKVYCVELDKIFNCIEDAKEYIGGNISITASASDTTHTATAGIDPITKNPLHWIYYSELHLFSKEELEDIKTRHARKSHERDSIKIICLNNKMIFDNAWKAAEWCGLNGNSNICSCIRGVRKHAGKDPITKEPLSWMKYSDYLKSTASSEVSA